MFTAAQILRGAPLSVLHFFSPSGAGGAGATLRRVRAAYSRTRCLPHPKGWASAPTGHLRAAFNGFSLRFPKVTDRTAGRCGFQFILRKNRTSALPFALGVLPKLDGAELGAARAGKRAGRLGNLPSLPAVSSVLPLVFQRQNRSSPHLPTNALTPRFSPSKVYGCHLTCRRGTNRLTGADMGFPVCVGGQPDLHTNTTRLQWVRLFCFLRHKFCAAPQTSFNKNSFLQNGVGGAEAECAAPLLIITS